MSKVVVRVVAGFLVALAVGCAGGGGSSDSTSSAPSAPASLSAIAGDGQNLIDWPPVLGATGYTLHWSNTTPIDLATASTIDADSPPVLHQGLVNGSTYYYCVTAWNAAGVSAPSPEASAVPASSASVYDPPWGATSSLTTASFDYDNALTSAQNGANLKAALLALQPGDRLQIGTGTYSVNSLFDLDLQGTALAPIWIVAEPGATPVLTRADASQNALNIGVSKTTRYVCLRGIEITGGDTGVKLYSCDQLWMDRCHIDYVGGPGIAANSADTAHLYLTRNEIDHTGGTGEGLYLGANYGAHLMSNSIVALNLIHDTGGTQGDGIEVKQGSYGNWVAENVVHDTHYPCILLYGTAGQAFNLVEKNVCWNSGDNVMQVQGEAIVRNNLLMNGANAFGSHDHQGSVTDLTFVHNTLINSGRGAQLSNWSGRPNMVFANNVVYSQNSQSISFSGSTGVTISGNIVVGAVSGASSGWIVGAGLGDFNDVSWDAVHRDASLSIASSILASGDPVWEVADDITGAARVGTVEAGCYDGP